MTRQFTERPARGLGFLFIAGLVVGSGLMYLLDPRQGNRRRAVARDKTVSFLNRSSHLGGKYLRHFRNQLQGVMAVVGENFRPAGVVSDRKLSDHVRSVIGRTISHPHAVDFAVHDGRVTVRGALRPHEAGAVVQAIEQIRGVRCVDNQILDSGSAAPTVQ